MPAKKGEVCVNGFCDLACPQDKTSCYSKCVDTKTDDTNCGACGNQCGSGQICKQGKCVLYCPDGYDICNNQCIDYQTNSQHCGSCNHACGNKMICKKGQCDQHCPPEQTECNGQCIDLLTNYFHCGACNNECPVGSMCASGKCVTSCPAGMKECLIGYNTYACIDPDVNNTHCGCDYQRIGNDCSQSDEKILGFCVKGECRKVCNENLFDCDESDDGLNCVDIMNDNKNCGGCNVVCPNNSACTDGACSCPDGYAGTVVDGKAVCGIEIKTASDLISLRDAYLNENLEKYQKLMPDADKYVFVVTQDIDLGSQNDWHGIGTDSYDWAFSGIFVGRNGVTISGKLNCETGDCGLFSSTDDAIIDNLNLNLTMTAKYGSTAGLIGKSINSTISRIYGKVDITSSAENEIGALIGKIDDAEDTRTIVQNVSLEGEIKLSPDESNHSSFGGIVGKADYAVFNNIISNVNITMTDSQSPRGLGGVVGKSRYSSYNGVSYNGTLSISMGHDVGGIVGCSYDDKISAVQTKGNLVIPGDYVQTLGGIVGFGENLWMSDASSKMNFDIQQISEMGGVTGICHDCQIDSSTYDGTIRIRIGSLIGGITGYSSGGKISSSHTTGSITLYSDSSDSYSDIGGIIGTGDEFTIEHSTSQMELDFQEHVQEAGGLAGRLTYSLVDSSEYNGTIHFTTCDSIGGIVGYQLLTTISNTTAKGSILNKNKNADYDDIANVGGIVGHEDDSNFSNIISAMDIHTNGVKLAGITGWSKSWDKNISNYTNVIYIGNISPDNTANSVGGLIGESCNVKAVNVQIIGNISGDADIGGMIGLSYCQQLTIANSGAYGSVKGTDQDEDAGTGGLVGLSSIDGINFYNTYSLMKVTAPKARAIIGYVDYATLNTTAVLYNPEYNNEPGITGAQAIIPRSSGNYDAVYYIQNTQTKLTDYLNKDITCNAQNVCTYTPANIEVKKWKDFTFNDGKTQLIPVTNDIPEEIIKNYFKNN